MPTPFQFDQKNQRLIPPQMTISDLLANQPQGLAVIQSVVGDVMTVAFKQFTQATNDGTLVIENGLPKIIAAPDKIVQFKRSDVVNQIARAQNQISALQAQIDSGNQFLDIFDSQIAAKNQTQTDVAQKAS